MNAVGGRKCHLIRVSAEEARSDQFCAAQQVPRHKTDRPALQLPELFAMTPARPIQGNPR